MIKIGVEKVDITPPAGIPLVGFAGRGNATGVHDPLYATVIVATSSNNTVAIVDFDLLGICDEIVADIRKKVAETTGLEGETLMISCTHTHYGPNLYSRDDRPDTALYQSMLPSTIAHTVGRALLNRREALIGVGWGESSIGINRREKLPDGTICLGQNPDDPIDRSVGVCRIDSVDGKMIAAIVNFATHPVSQSGQMRRISADYPGKTRDVVEQLTGAHCIFLQGACGDINSIRMEDSYEPARSLGTRLGCEVVRVLETITTEIDSGVGAVQRTTPLPRYRYGYADGAEGLANSLAADLRRLRSNRGSPGEIYWTESRLKQATVAVQSWKTGKLPEPVPAELGAYMIGRLHIATAPGEIFTRIGSAVKSSSTSSCTFFAGYSGGTIGYVPTPDAYPEGGYEVTHGCQVDPDASSAIVDVCGELLGQVRDRSG